jgi:hypothetical protein
VAHLGGIGSGRFVEKGEFVGVVDAEADDVAVAQDAGLLLNAVDFDSVPGAGILDDQFRAFAADDGVAAGGAVVP